VVVEAEELKMEDLNMNTKVKAEIVGEGTPEVKLENRELKLELELIPQIEYMSHTGGGNTGIVFEKAGPNVKAEGKSKSGGKKQDPKLEVKDTIPDMEDILGWAPPIPSTRNLRPRRRG